MSASAGTATTGQVPALPSELIEPLERLDAVLRAAIARAEKWYGVVPGHDPFRGLYLDRSDVERELRCAAGTDRSSMIDPEASAYEQVPDSLFDAGAASAEPSRLAWLASSYRLAPFEIDTLIVALAPEIDTRYERVYAFLQDDVTKRQPTVELMLRLLCRGTADRLAQCAALQPSATLLSQRLLRSTPVDGAAQLSASLRVDEQIALFLLGIPRLDRRLAGVLAPCAPGGADATALLNGRGGSLARAAGAFTAGTLSALRLAPSGPKGSGKRTLAAALARCADQPMLTLDAARLVVRCPTIEAFEDAVHLAFREAWFRGAVLYVSGVDASESTPAAERRRVLLREARGHAGIVVLASETAWQAPPGTLPGLVRLPLAPPRPETRYTLWCTALAQAAVGVERTGATDVIARELADRFALTPGQISDAAAAAALDCIDAGDDATPTAGAAPRLRDTLLAAARAQGGHALEQYAQRVRPVHGWDDLILPDDSIEQLDELCARAAARHTVLSDWGFGERLSRGRGITALFTGPSGTGKTMAAEVVAGALAVDLFVIDLAGVISKYIGETEQNLDRVFRAAEHANGVLFFDEADALFGKRSEVRDAHDRYANIEICYLLQKMEQYDGIAILATNLRDNLDDAFVRRLSFSIHFPFPDEASRLRIWRGVWPAAAPLASDIDFETLAGRVHLSGGNIRNVALAAAHLAARRGDVIALGDIVRAIRREYQKLGKHLAEPELLELVRP